MMTTFFPMYENLFRNPKKRKEEEEKSVECALTGLMTAGDEIR